MHFLLETSYEGALKGDKILPSPSWSISKEEEDKSEEHSQGLFTFLAVQSASDFDPFLLP